ncbi:AfsR/SARP family transcriptional regulator [Catenulispora yoronensis]
MDLAEFRAKARAGRQELAAGRAGQAVRTLGAALRLWRGAPAGDVRPSLSLERRLSAIEDERLSCVEDWVEARQRVGDDAGLVVELRELTAAHPLRERLWCRLVLALYRSGDVSGALTAFRQARDTLVRELGVDPGPELTGLHRAVLARDRDLDLPAPHLDSPEAAARPIVVAVLGDLSSAEVSQLMECLQGFGAEAGRPPSPAAGLGAAPWRAIRTSGS